MDSDPGVCGGEPCIAWAYEQSHREEIDRQIAANEEA